MLACAWSGRSASTVIDELWRPIAAEERERRKRGERLARKLVELPTTSHRSEGLLGPLQALLVDGKPLAHRTRRQAVIPWKRVTPITIAPTTPTITVPPVQSSTPPVVCFGLFDPPLLLAPVRIFTAVRQSVAYARPLAT